MRPLRPKGTQDSPVALQFPRLDERTFPLPHSSDVRNSPKRRKTSRGKELMVWKMRGVKRWRQSLPIKAAFFGQLNCAGWVLSRSKLVCILFRHYESRRRKFTQILRLSLYSSFMLKLMTKQKPLTSQRFSYEFSRPSVSEKINK